MYDESLQFDSDKLEDLTLDWDDIRQIRSAQTLRVAFLDGVIAAGRLVVDGDSVRVIGATDYQYDRSQVLSCVAGEPRERNYWSGGLGAGINVRSGNTTQTEFHAAATSCAAPRSNASTSPTSATSARATRPPSPTTSV